MTLITFEGPTGCGKTTFAERLSKETGIPFWVRPRGMQEAKEKYHLYPEAAQYEWTLLRLIDWSKNSLILDRHPVISDWVYSEINAKDNPHRYHMGYSSPLISVGPVLIVHVPTPTAAIMKRRKERGDFTIRGIHLVGCEHLIQREQDLYIDALHHVRKSTMNEIWEVTEENFPLLVKKLKEEVK